MVPAPRPDGESETLSRMYDLILGEHRWLESQLQRVDDQLTGLRAEISAIRQSLAALPCERHAGEIAEAKAAAEEVRRQYHLARLVAGVGTAVVAVAAGLTGLASNAATFLGIGRQP